MPSFIRLTDSRDGAALWIRRRTIAVVVANPKGGAFIELELRLPEDEPLPVRETAEEVVSLCTQSMKPERSAEP